jgi:hypothetical protein
MDVLTSNGNLFCAKPLKVDEIIIVRRIAISIFVFFQTKVE